MLSKLNSAYYLSRQYFLNLLSRKPRALANQTGYVCLSIAPTEFNLVYVRYGKDKPNIDVYETFSYEGRSLKSAIGDIVKKNKLKMLPCIWVLHTAEYQMLLTDELPVTQAEFQSAIRWKMKDLIHMPVEDIVVDYFPIPRPLQESQSKIMTVIARTSHLQLRSDQIYNGGLDLQIIDVPELCNRNITALYENDENSTLLILLDEKAIQIVITYQKQFYFNRRLIFGLGALGTTSQDERIQALDRLSLELRRSSEYFQNQWRLPAPVRYFIVPTLLITPDEIDNLSKRINLEIKMLNILDWMTSSQPLDLELQGTYFSLCGAALRHEGNV